MRDLRRDDANDLDYGFARPSRCARTFDDTPNVRILSRHLNAVAVASVASVASVAAQRARRGRATDRVVVAPGVVSARSSRDGDG